MKDKNSDKIRFYIDRKSALARAAIILMLISAIFRVIGCWGLWTDSYFLTTQLILPICCNLLFALCIIAFGKRGFWLSVIPVLLGVVFFTVKSFGFDSWVHTLLCIGLYLLVAVIYSGTVFGVIGTKWLLPPLFGLPLLYHIFVEDLARMQDVANPVTLAEGMQEISVLCILAALFCAGLGMKRFKKEPPTPVTPPVKEPETVVAVESVPAESAMTEPETVEPLATETITPDPVVTETETTLIPESEKTTASSNGISV